MSAGIGIPITGPASSGPGAAAVAVMPGSPNRLSELPSDVIFQISGRFLQAEDRINLLKVSRSTLLATKQDGWPISRSWRILFESTTMICDGKIARLVREYFYDDVEKKRIPCAGFYRAAYDKLSENFSASVLRAALGIGLHEIIRLRIVDPINREDRAPAIRDFPDLVPSDIGDRQKRKHSRMRIPCRLAGNTTIVVNVRLGAGRNSRYELIQIISAGGSLKTVFAFQTFRERVTDGLVDGISRHATMNARADEGARRFRAEELELTPSIRGGLWTEEKPYPSAPFQKILRQFRA